LRKITSRSAAVEIPSSARTEDLGAGGGGDRKPAALVMVGEKAGWEDAAVP